MVFYDAYLRRLRKYSYSAPAGSMEKHNRRIAALHFAKLMVEGKSSSGVVGEFYGAVSAFNVAFLTGICTWGTE